MSNNEIVEKWLRKINMSESAVQTRVMLEASKQGVTLWRNNSGVAQDDKGRRTIRYGLANNSAKLNKVMKSSDLIGITPTTVTPDMVGTTVGIFTAYEIKEGKWAFKNTQRERAQLAFINLVQKLGGKAAFINGEGQLQ